MSLEVREPVRVITPTIADASTLYDIAIQSGLVDDYTKRTPYYYAVELQREDREEIDFFGMKSVLALRGDKPVGFITVSGVDLEGDEAEILLGDMATLPEERDFEIFSRLVSGLFDQQEPGITYLYMAEAKAETSYRGLKKKGVQRWTRKKGYHIYLEENHAEKVANGQKIVSVVLYQNTDNNKDKIIIEDYSDYIDDFQTVPLVRQE